MESLLSEFHLANVLRARKSPLSSTTASPRLQGYYGAAVASSATTSDANNTHTADNNNSSNKSNDDKDIEEEEEEEEEDDEDQEEDPEEEFVIRAMAQAHEAWKKKLVEFKARIQAKHASAAFPPLVDIPPSLANEGGAEYGMEEVHDQGSNEGYTTAATAFEYQAPLWPMVYDSDDGTETVSSDVEMDDHYRRGGASPLPPPPLPPPRPSVDGAGLPEYGDLTPAYQRVSSSSPSPSPAYGQHHHDHDHHHGSAAAPGSSASGQVIYDRTWLIEQCQRHVSVFGEGGAHGGGDENSSMSAKRLSIDVLTILRSSQTDDGIQMGLVDLLGFENFELITTLITHRKVIVDNVIAQSGLDPNAHVDLLSAAGHKDDGDASSGGGGAQRVPLTGSFTIQTEAEKQAVKQARKDRKRQGGGGAGVVRDEEEEAALSSAMLGYDQDNLRQVREEQLRQNAAAPLASSGRVATDGPEYPNVYQASRGGTMLTGFGQKFALPAGTLRVDEKDYEEITIPISKVAPRRVTEKTILISEMDSLCRTTFEAYTSLNRIQSIVYPIAYGTNENVLMCAPTGAGKTDVALLTILRTLSQYCTPTPSPDVNPKDYRIAKNDFKIVFVAPMKALAAEIVRKYGSRLKWLGIEVRELTGDMQLTKAEIAKTQIIVTTPEKWDVVTRKSTGDVELAQKVRLLIIDEVHLLHDDRGAVLESLVARTLRQVETSQSMIRIVGLSATLPNYVDVASFLRVNPYQGLFFFDGGFRPVPLEQHFCGVRGKYGSGQYNRGLDQTCYDKVRDLVMEGHQVMVFVHSRKDTVKTAQMLREKSNEEGEADFFTPNDDIPTIDLMKRDVAKSKNKELRELFQYGFGIHHAGMLRSDRTLTEKLFADGALKVLCCTATLAWGVNLPAYAVVIKGTQVYDTQKGSFVDLSILDVMQIFGRAGRPQYETHGVGYILTSLDKLNHYVTLITQQLPIESRFIENLVDNLNAELSLGTITNVDEAVTWLSYTYLYVRMRKNPLVYGMSHMEPIEDPLLGKKRRDLIIQAARHLHKAQMVIFDEPTGYLTPKDLGRIASNFYVSFNSITTYNELMKPRMTEADVLNLVSRSTEFVNIKSRDNEQTELKKLLEQACPCDVKGGLDLSSNKVNVLLQAAITQAPLDDFALVSDSGYITQNASRIIRALFEIALNRNWGPVANVLLSLGKSVDKRMWSFEHPLAQFGLPRDIVHKLEARSHPPSIEEMREMSVQELGELVRFQRMGSTIAKCVDQFPTLLLEAQVAPITRNVLRVTLEVTADFVWNDRIHGFSDPWWIWVEDSSNTNADILHSEYFLLSRKQLGQPQTIAFTIPVIEPLPPQIFVRAVSDRWIGAESVYPISFKHLILPELYPPHTDLLDLQPLPVSALHNDVLEEICSKRFSHFNPVQTQIFHTLYNTSHNALIGAPTGSGKTVAAELAMWWAFKDQPGSKVVYIAPLKALVRERVDDWTKRLVGPMNKKLVELTGDVTPDIKSIEGADIIITTPEKWDGISRNWQTRSYVQKVSCVIIDEIHLLGADRGPILEVIVSRMNYIGAQLERKIRLVGLSTALANAHDLADWLGIQEVGLFNFRHSVRPVPLEIYIDGFPGKHYCPRMATMNKPTFAAIKTHSPTQPAIVFVSSRRQTRLTAQDLIAYCAMEDNPRRFLHMAEEELEDLLPRIQDSSLRLALGFGIGLHHAGLPESDRKVVEELFVGLKIQVLIATSTLAWGVNFPAHLVVIKGTEYYDAKTRTYVDFPITDVLQMMGRAGRPQFDNEGIARIFVQDSKKNFYKKFLHEPFPVESSLHKCLDDHLNAEIVGGTVKSKQDAMDYLTWTYFFRRLQMNPSYYGVEDLTPQGVNTYLSDLIETTVSNLEKSHCLQVTDNFEIEPTSLGKICSFYYLMHPTIRHLQQQLRSDSTFEDLLMVLCGATEYAELPVRHNEDGHNKELEQRLPLLIDASQTYDSPHAKAFLLLQAYFERMKDLPVTDYITDTVTVLDQAVRLLQAMIDITAEKGMLSQCQEVMHILQCVKQARWKDESLLTLPRVERSMLPVLTKARGGSKRGGRAGKQQQGEGPEAQQAVTTTTTTNKAGGVERLWDLAHMSEKEVKALFGRIPTLTAGHVQEIWRVVERLPVIGLTTKIDTGIKTFLVQDQTYKLQVELNRVRRPGVFYDGRVHCPKFPKPQWESWWMVLEDPEQKELVALKRVNMRTGPQGTFVHRVMTKVDFVAPARQGRHVWKLHLFSDGYLGMDQTIDVHFDVLG
ncbi:activating signal cointegrator 1 complex subunit [Actinomortierella ambigua]|uniref:Activating signal cointegrator 1 complex subunit n=1 Tax=Actinomortierella ambigua TaxID=1343610 RepID=A0A9P6PSP5_9FUNG|nr:activating signal cointegrator 1 complex subunit [Actinomortierella ambigua]